MIQIAHMFRNSEWGGIWGRDYDYDWWLFEALELEIVWTRARDEPDVKSGEVLQAAVQTISSQAKAGYSNSQQKGTLIDDFTQHVELFSSKEQQMTEEKYLHTEKDYLDLLLAVKRKFDYQR